MGTKKRKRDDATTADSEPLCRDMPTVVANGQRTLDMFTPKGACAENRAAPTRALPIAPWSMYNEALGGRASETYGEALETVDVDDATLSKSAGVSEAEALERARIGIAIATRVRKTRR